MSCHNSGHQRGRRLAPERLTGEIAAKKPPNGRAGFRGGAVSLTVGSREPSAVAR
jgi:hypothetical protein